MRHDEITTDRGTFAVSAPNSGIAGDGFYVSYNDVDTDAYGGVTTALVTGQMERFLILNGDHRQAYASLVPQGLGACLAYYRENLDLANFRSDAFEVSAPPEDAGEYEPEASPGFGR